MASAAETTRVKYQWRIPKERKLKKAQYGYTIACLLSAWNYNPSPSMTDALQRLSGAARLSAQQSGGRLSEAFFPRIILTFRSITFSETQCSKPWIN